MGWLTPILIRNDSLDTIEMHPAEAVNGIAHKIKTGDAGSVGVANHANPIEVLQTRHNLLDRLLIVSGNTMFDLESPDALLEIAQRSPAGREYVEGVLHTAVTQLERLQKKLDVLP